jgi:hypothetical protein
MRDALAPLVPGNCSPKSLMKIVKRHLREHFGDRDEPANFRLRVKMKLRRKVSKLPAILQLSALRSERG